jgi:hypothetical protein
MSSGFTLASGWVGVGLAVAACKAAGSPRASSSATESVDCSAVRAPAEPDLIGWDAAARTQLDHLRRQNVVAVRYETRGCEVSLELLPECFGPRNKYVYVPSSSSDTKIAREPADLFAKVPLGAPSLAPFLKDGRALRADVKLVGSYELPPGSTISEYDLVGPECRRATHVVAAVHVGGFAIGAVDRSQVNTLGSLFRKGEHGDSVTHEGYPEICDRAAAEGIELGGCVVPLRLSLIALGAGATHEAAPVRPAAAVETSEVESVPDAGRSVFDQAAVERVTRAHVANVRRTCWEPMGDSIKRITVAVTTRIEPGGRVAQADAQVQDSDGPADVASSVAHCIANDVKVWVFPEPKTEKVLTLPFHLIRQ